MGLKRRAAMCRNILLSIIDSHIFTQMFMYYEQPYIHDIFQKKYK